MKSWSLRARLVLTVTTVSMIVCVVVVLIADYAVRVALEHAVDQTMISAGESLDASLAVSSPAAELGAVERAVRYLITSGELRGAVLFDAGRKVAIAQPPELAREPALSRWPAGGRPREVQWVLDGTPVAARFVLLGDAGTDLLGAWTVVDTTEVQWHLHRLRSLLVGLAAGVLVGTLGLTWFVMRFALAPLTSLSSSAARLAGGELTWRHPERGPTEIASLARRLNALAEQLEASQTELTRSLSRENERTAGHARYLEQANRTLLDLANRDPLTGLANRRRLELELERHIDLARETGQPLAVVMMDLDNFKAYNDTAGHLAGDELLRTVASTLRGRTRITDLVVRWGGDEFCILIPHTTPERALAAARSLVEAVAEATRSLPLPESLARPGVSAGVACFPDDGEDGTALIARADAALYAAKESGRGRALRLGGG